MNHVYRLLWNEFTQSFVVVSESAKSRGKRSGGSKAAMLLLGTMLAGGALAQQPPLPSGGRVASGQAAISSAGSTMTVRQGSDKAVINWDSFSIGKTGTVNFVQPSAASVVLNRVVGTEQSLIDGALNANGQVFLLNSNGVLFNRGASVNTAGLVASTMALSDTDFNAANYRFSNNGSTASVLNLGTIHVADGGYAALLGRQVANGGTITARLGTVALAAGDKISLNFNGNSLLNVTVDKGVLGALVENRDAIYADGGQVILTAKAVDALLANVVNNTGEIRARTVANRAGHIYLLGGLAEGGSTQVAGTLDASAPDGGDGGFIETSGAHLNIGAGAVVSTYAPHGVTGNWLMDPNDYVIAASGGNITGAALGTALNSSNVTIQTTTQGTGGGSGDIIVNDAVTKTGGSATTLTLLAERNIAVNQAISSSGGRLNVVMTADSDNNSSGGTQFGAAGSVTTKGGNAVVGAMSGNSVVSRGQFFDASAAGGFIDVGMGNLDINVSGSVTLAGASLRGLNSTGYPTSYYNDGSGRYNQPNYINVNGASIVNTDLVATSNIVTSTDVTLSGAAIGSAAHPLTVSAPASGFVDGTSAFPSAGRSLYVNNGTGDSYVSETGAQLFSRISVALGNQANSTHNIQIMGDAGGNGSSGGGHIILHTDGAGLLNLASGDISTGGQAGAAGADPLVFATSVSLSAPNITFANNSVDTGPSALYFVYPSHHEYGRSSYAASFSANTSGTLSSSQVDNVADITAYSLTLTGPNLGTIANPLELGAGTTLYTNNTGASTYLKALSNSYTTLSMASGKAAGVQSLTFSDGDHINYSSDGSELLVPGLSSTSGIDLRNSNRNLTLIANSGYVEFNTNSVNTGGGAFGVTINTGNADRLAGNAVFATNAKDGLAEITAGDLAFTMPYNLAGGISNLEIARGGTVIGETLSLTTYGGDVDIRELSPNHFKTINVNLQGPDVAQHIAIDLNGPDDVNFSDSGSLVSLDGSKVNLSDGNRNWNLQTASRMVQIDGSSLGSGNYTVTGGTGLRLNGDVLTNGGSIFLSGGGNGITLLKTVRVDSNADDVAHITNLGAAGTVYLGGNLSAAAPGAALTVAAGSSDHAGATIQVNSSAANAGGAYLSGLTLNNKGVGNSGDGVLYLFGGSYLLNGAFSATGNTYLYSNTFIDTEQGNVAGAGAITFAGQALTGIGAQYHFDASTTAAGFSGGNIDLGGTFTHGVLNASSVLVNASGGSGGAGGAINLPAVATLQSGQSNSQTYTGGVITLNGNLSSDKGAISLNGDTRLANNVTISTWVGGGSQASATAGAVSIVGVGVSACRRWRRAPV